MSHASSHHQSAEATTASAAAATAAAAAASSRVSHIGTRDLEDLEHEQELERLVVMASDSISAVEIGKADALINSVLRKDIELRELVADNDAQLHRLQQDFVHEYCAHADDLVHLYRQTLACEEKLVDYEDQIVTFQGRLTDTAEDIVRMQQDTYAVVQRMSNRKQVGERIEKVYEALHTCDTFCDAVHASSHVDDQYLDHIRQLESKISFLADNQHLHESAVYQEIHPKLEAAARTAGDQLHRFLVRKFTQLTEPNTNVALQQQALQRQGEYAYSFLYRYNPPIASELTGLYLRQMVDVYLRHTKPAAKDLSEVTPFASRTFEPIMSSEVIHCLLTNQPIPSVATVSNASSVSISRQSVSTARAGSSSHRSVSLSIEERLNRFKDKMSAKISDFTHKREAGFDDQVNSVRAIITRNRSELQLHPAITIAADATNCWIARFNELFRRLINAVAHEAQFVRHFFFTVEPNPEEEENMLRDVFSRTTQHAEELISSKCLELTDMATIVGALRCLEVFKNFVSQYADPLPILLLAGTMEAASCALRDRLKFLFKRHDASILSASNAKSPAIDSPPGSTGKSLTEIAQSDAGFAAALRHHDAVACYSVFASQLHYLNTIKLVGSRVQPLGTPRYVFDEELSTLLNNSFKQVVNVVTALSHRFTTPLAPIVFTINAYSRLLRDTINVEPTTLIDTDIDVGGAKTTTAAADSSNGAGQGTSQREEQQAATTTNNSSASVDSPTANNNSVGDDASAATVMMRFGATSFIGQTDYVKEVEARLDDNIALFLQQEVSSSPVASCFAFVKDCCAKLGDGFFQDQQQQQSQDGTAISSLSLTEQEVVSVVTTFAKNWKDSLSTLNTKCHVLFDASCATSTPSSSAASATDVAAATNTPSNFTVVRVLQSYFTWLLDVNRRLARIVNHNYGNHSVVQAKLVNRHSIVQEMKRLVKQD